ncbi:MAG TPA: tRNA glutamyl-Q(34) synthetase GluQRS [Marinobacter sp.]|nr:tRNA glutamyl-Q(34) synthetase GluQRS [Marinobacter sp.]
MASSNYRGRFAPSPTGPLHFGSLVTAIASWLEARSAGGQWLVRIEDLDSLREPTDAVDRILDSLACHALLSDEPVRFQSRRHHAYEQAITRLLDAGLAYVCPCSRKELQANAGRHPHHCRTARINPGQQPAAVRFALYDEHARWTDTLLGEQHQQVQAELDDPVIRRKEGFYAYQLAVVVDDIDQGISHVVRGSDLLDMTAQQQQIFRALGAKPPDWLHIPVILNDQGQKLSKQTHAPALDDQQPARNLVAALAALGQNPPPGLALGTPEAVLDWARRHWQRGRIPLTSRQHHAINPDTSLGSDR